MEKLTIHIHPVPRFRMSAAVPEFWARTGTTLPYLKYLRLKHTGKKGKGHLCTGTEALYRLYGL